MADRAIARKCSSAIRSAACWGILLTAWAVEAAAFSPQHPADTHVLVVYNSAVAGSQRVAREYVRKRNIDSKNICKLAIPASGTQAPADISEISFQARIHGPVGKCLIARGRDRILYIVLTYGVPFRIRPAAGGMGQSVDQRLQMPGEAKRVEPNPYFSGYAGTGNSGGYAPFVSLQQFRNVHPEQRLYSVWRLDGATPAAALALVDKGMAAEAARKREPIACFDRRYGAIDKVRDDGYGAGDWEIHRAAEVARAAGFHVVEDASAPEFGTSPAPLRCDNASFYAGWYQLDHYNDAFSWAPGAIGLHLDSLSAASPRSGASWAANALRRGITVTSGAVSEPYLPNLPRAGGILHDLVAGATVGDAFLRNTPLLNWQIINIGDPLYVPFGAKRAK